MCFMSVVILYHTFGMEVYTEVQRHILLLCLGCVHIEPNPCFQLNDTVTLDALGHGIRVMYPTLTFYSNIKQNLSQCFVLFNELLCLYSQISRRVHMPIPFTDHQNPMIK